MAARRLHLAAREKVKKKVAARKIRSSTRCSSSRFQKNNLPPRRRYWRSLYGVATCTTHANRCSRGDRDFNLLCLFLPKMCEPVHTAARPAGGIGNLIEKLRECRQS